MKITKKGILAFAFLFIAILSLIFSIVCFSMSASYYSGTTESNLTYGGDAYTGMQNAAAQTANNVFYLGLTIINFQECITTICGFVFLITSLVLGSIAIVELCVRSVTVTTVAEAKPVNDTQKESTVISTFPVTPVSVGYWELKCPECGHIQPNNNTHCEKCDAKFKAVHTKSETKAATPSQESTTTNSSNTIAPINKGLFEIECPKCHSTMPNNANKCIGCGQLFE